MTAPRISRQIPLSRLSLPDTDVRITRPNQEVRQIAQSMGDPDVGQQQPIAVFPSDHDDRDGDLDSADLADIYDGDVELVIHDGVTRYRAAEQLGWSTIWGVVIPEPPDDEIIARLEANTERIDMSDFETFKVLKDEYESSDATLSDLAEKVGCAVSTLSNIFSLFDAPEFLRQTWQDEDHPLGVGHAKAVRSLLTDDSVEQYKAAGDLDNEQAREEAMKDARLMVDVQAKHDLTLNEFRARVKRCRNETLDQLRDQRSLDEKRADGQAESAERTVEDHTPNVPDHDPCIVCGEPSDRKIALDVCGQDYGKLSKMQADGDKLMAVAEGTGNANANGDASPQDAVDTAVDLLTALDGLPQAEQEQVFAELQEALAPPEAVSND